MDFSRSASRSVSREPRATAAADRAVATALAVMRERVAAGIRCEFEAAHRAVGAIARRYESELAALVHRHRSVALAEHARQAERAEHAERDERDERVERVEQAEQAGWVRRPEARFRFELAPGDVEALSRYRAAWWRAVGLARAQCLVQEAETRAERVRLRRLGPVAPAAAEHAAWVAAGAAAYARAGPDPAC